MRVCRSALRAGARTGRALPDRGKNAKRRAMGDYEQVRTHMVDNQLRTNDVTDLRVLDAMESVPRERFVPTSKRCIAYSD